MKPMRATSDLHLTQATAPYVWAALAELRKDATKYGGPTVIAGDLFEHAHTVHMPTWNRLREELYLWPDRVFVIVGNHDQFGKGWAPVGDGWQNCLEGLKGGSCTLISKPSWLGIGRMLPYCQPDHFAAALGAVGPAPIGARVFLPIVWTHAGYKGAYRNAMSRDRDGVSCAAIPPGHLVVSGHYHMPQTLGRIVYCGSPYETTFAEERQQKGWLRWADAESDPVPVRIPFGDLGAPRHYTVEWSPELGSPVVPSMITERDIMRVRTQASRSVAKAAMGQLTRAGLDGIPVLSRPDEGTRNEIDTSSGPLNAVREWVVVQHADQLHLPDPGAMLAWADEVGLMEGL
jgi:hypothetical protein